MWKPFSTQFQRYHFFNVFLLWFQFFFVQSLLSKKTKLKTFIILRHLYFQLPTSMEILHIAFLDKSTIFHIFRPHNACLVNQSNSIWSVKIIYGMVLEVEQMLDCSCLIEVQINYSEPNQNFSSKTTIYACDYHLIIYFKLKISDKT